ncbi:MAG: c-type cytochrome [Campylobacterota bacterium]|nr:c-type cytochrome [Campylobacterota bacterium]
MKKQIIGVMALSVLSSVLSADGAALYKKCAACHGTNGEKPAMNKSKIIKDMSNADFVAAMKGYKDGSYGAGLKNLMVMQVKALDDAQIQALADYIVK